MCARAGLSETERKMDQCCCEDTQNVVKVDFVNSFYSTVMSVEKMESFICNVTGRNYRRVRAGGRERESERKGRKSERQSVAEKGFLASVMNLTVGQISRSLETTNPLK